MQFNYDAPNVAWEPVDKRLSRRHSWLQIFSTHFRSRNGYLLSSKTVLIPRKSQQTNTCSNTCFKQPQESPNLFELNFKCLLKPFIWFALDCKWLDYFYFYKIQISTQINFWIDCISWTQEVLSFTYHTY